MALARRLRWRCRRGTREMDLILERFLDAAADGLDEETRQGLERLLDQSDQDILDWIARRAAPPDAVLAAVVDRIRAAAATPGARRVARAS